MKSSEKYTLEIQALESDIELLKNGNIYEVDHIPGSPKYYTIGRRMEDNLRNLIQKMDANAPGDIETVIDHLKQ